MITKEYVCTAAGRRPGGCRISRRERGASRTAAAFSLIEVLIVVAVIAILLVLSSAGFQQFRMNAENVKCVSNLRGSAQAMLRYFNDNNMEFFPGKNWSVYPSTRAKPNSGMLDYLWPTPVKSTANATSDPEFRMDSLLTCPAMKQKYPRSYPQSLNRGFGVNYYLFQSYDGAVTPGPQRMVNVPRASAMWILTDAPFNSGVLGSINVNTASGGGRYLSMPHSGRQNVCFLDGHIETLGVDDFVTPANPRAFWGNLSLAETQPAP